MNPATGVGVAEAMTAAARAAATADGLMNDPYAASFVHAAGIAFFVRLVDGELDLSRLGADGGFPRLAELFAARSWFFDEFLADAGKAGIRQVVILGSGLDTRPYRLWWPAGTMLYELDRPRLIEFKTISMRAWGVPPTVNRRAAGIDLLGDWPAALRRVGFDTASRTAWVAEALFLGFLPPRAQDRLLDNVTELSAAGSRLAADYTKPVSRAQEAHLHQLAERWRRRGLDIDLTALIYSGERSDVADYLAARGWGMIVGDTAELFVAAEFPQLSPPDLDGVPGSVEYLTAVR